jgi:hypothetical protein
MNENQANGHARLPLEDNEALLRTLARFVAEEISTQRLRPILRELVLMAELEREAIRRDGVGRSLLYALRKAGFRLSLDERGRLLVGPKRLLTKQWVRFISLFRSELVRELTQGW